MMDGAAAIETAACRPDRHTAPIAGSAITASPSQLGAKMTRFGALIGSLPAVGPCATVGILAFHERTTAAKSTIVDLVIYDVKKACPWW